MVNAVSVVSRKLESQTNLDVAEVKRIFPYFIWTVKFGVINKGGSCILQWRRSWRWWNDAGSAVSWLSCQLTSNFRDDMNHRSRNRSSKWGYDRKYLGKPTVWRNLDPMKLMWRKYPPKISSLMLWRNPLFDLDYRTYEKLWVWLNCSMGKVLKDIFTIQPLLILLVLTYIFLPMSNTCQSI